MKTSYRDLTCGDARPEHAGREVTLSGWVNRRRDMGQLIFIDLRDRYGVTQVVIDAQDSPEAHEIADGCAQRVRAVRRGHARQAPGRHREHQAGDRRDRAARNLGAHAVDARSRRRSRSTTRRVHRRDAPAQVPLPRPAPRAAQPPIWCCAPSCSRASREVHHDERLRRGRDADPDQVDARRCARLHRPVAPPAGQVLRAAAEPAAAQAAADGGRLRPLLPDRPLHARRGHARRPRSPSSPSSTSR